MEEKKEQVRNLLQRKVNGYVKIENERLFGGWCVTIKYHDYNFGVIVFEENIRRYPVNDIVEYVLEKYKYDIIDYYFK